MNMTGIIFSEMYNDELNAFTHDRNMAAIPFGGRYRLIDFTLSNMVNIRTSNIKVIIRTVEIRNRQIPFTDAP